MITLLSVSSGCAHARNAVPIDFSGKVAISGMPDIRFDIESSDPAVMQKSLTDAFKGQGGNDYLIILIKDEDGENIAKINVYNDKENTQIITTFQPLNCTESQDGKIIQDKTRRYFTAYNSGKQNKRQKIERWDKCEVCGGLKTCPKDSFCETIPN